MNNIGTILAYLYRDEPTPPANYEVATDEQDNQRIRYWDEAALGPRPTERQLADAWLPALRAQKTQEMQHAFAAECERDFASTWEALALMAAEPRDTRLAALRERRLKLRDKVAYINAPERTEAELEALQW